MSVLNAAAREAGEKGRKLRREGIIPAVLYGKHLNESELIKIPKADVEQFLKTNSVGSRVELIIGAKKFSALIKEISYTPAVMKIEHLSFQALKEGERVTSVSHIILTNKDMVDGIVLQSLAELSYKALPSDIIDRIELNVKSMTVGDKITVAQLDISKNSAIEILTDSESLVVSVLARKELPAEPAQEDSSENAGQADSAE